MRWKNSRRGHDRRLIDLLATFALLILIGSAYLYFTHDRDKPGTTAFIVPSQHVHW
jgi:hypothetical protein